LSLLANDDPTVRAWGVRAAGNARVVGEAVRSRIVAMANDAEPDVRLQVAIASRKIEAIDPVPVLLKVLTGRKADPLLPHIVWQNLHPLLESQADVFVRLATQADLKASPDLAALIPRAIEHMLARRDAGPGAVATLIRSLVEHPDADAET